MVTTSFIPYLAFFESATEDGTYPEKPVEHMQDTVFGTERETGSLLPQCVRFLSKSGFTELIVNVKDDYYQEVLYLTNHSQNQ